MDYKKFKQAKAVEAKNKKRWLEVNPKLDDESGIYSLGHIIREVCGYKNIPFVFVDVPTQYPELKKFAQTFDNLVILKPKISFAEVCKKYGFPMISKEVSNCVSGARKYVKYLDSQKSKNTILTDRQTDRQFRMLAIWQTC